MVLSKKKLTAAILLGVSLLASNPIGFAEENGNDLDTYSIDDMIVTASSYEQEVKNAPADITIISHDEIEKRGVTDLRDILSNVEGIDVRSSNGRMGAPEISIRGMDSKYTLILIDGVAQNGASSAAIGPNGFGAQMSSFIPPTTSIERVEIIRGPMSTLYGSDAIGGVINIITKKSDGKTHGSFSIDNTFETESGRKDTQRYSAYITGPIEKDKLDLSLRGKFIRRSASTTGDGETEYGGNRTPSGMKNWDIGMNLKWNPDANKNNTYWLDVDSAVDDQTEGDAGINAGVRFDRRKMVLGSINKTNSGEFNTTLSWDTTRLKSFIYPLLRDTNKTIETKYITNLWDDKHKLVVGGKFTKESLEDGQLPGEQNLESNNYAFYAEDTWKIDDKLDFTYGLRYEKPDHFSDHYSPRGYLVYRFDDNWAIKGGISTGFKAPTLAQTQNSIVSYTGGYHARHKIPVYGNSNLDPESSVNSEIGFYYGKHNGVNAHISFFENNFKNKIDMEEINANKYQYVNSGRGRSRGIEIGTKIPFSDKWNMTANYSLNISKVVGGKHDGASLLSTPKHSINAKVNWIPDDRFNMWLGMEYRNGMHRYTGTDTVKQHVIDALGTEYRPYAVFNLGGSYKLSNSTTLNFGINNLFNKDFDKTTIIDGDEYNAYYKGGRGTSGTYISGRSYWLGLTFEF